MRSRKPSVIHLIALFYAGVLLVTMGLRAGPIAKFMRWKLLQEFGRISYCFYLIHVAVGYFCFGFLTHGIIHFTDWRSEVIGLLSISIGYALARLSWNYFENPMLQRGHRFKYETTSLGTVPELGERIVT